MIRYRQQWRGALIAAAMILSLSSCKVLDFTVRDDETYSETIKIEVSETATAEIAEDVTYYYFTSEDGTNFIRNVYAASDDKKDDSKDDEDGAENGETKVSPEDLIDSIAQAMSVKIDVSSDMTLHKGTLTMTLGDNDWDETTKTAVMACIEKTMQYYFEPDDPYSVTVTFE